MMIEQSSEPARTIPLMVSQASDHTSRSNLVAAQRELDRARAANDALWVAHAEARRDAVLERLLRRDRELAGGRDAA
jgi:hypothetical protein